MDYLIDHFISQLPFYDDIRPYIAIARPYINTALNTTTYVTTSILLPFINTLIQILSTSEQNPLVLFAASLGTLIVSFYMLNWVRRQIFWWIGLIVQLAFWVALGLGALLLWQVGPQKCLDAVVLFYQELQVANGQAEGGMRRSKAAGLSGHGRGGEYGMHSNNARTGWR